MNIKQENLGDLVWARMRFCPYWPARIVNTPPEMGKTPRDKVCVLFFGTKEFGFVDKKKLENYAENRAKFCGKGKGLHFKDAVRQIDEYIADPVKFRSHAFVKPAMNRIAIKTERDIERRLGVKIERDSTNQMAQNDVKNSSSTWEKEKQALVDKIVALKAENQQSTLAQKKTQSDNDALMLSKQRLEKTILENEAKFSTRLKQLQFEIAVAKKELDEMKVNSQKVICDLKQKLSDGKDTFSKKISELECQINDAKKDYSDLKANSQKSVSEMKRENKVLMAQVKQFQTGSQQNPNQDYEVDAILNHKETKNGRRYLIRWVGYGSDDDTWEKAENLNCPKLLAKYTRSLKNNRQ